jgi:hypothetical protein
MASTIALLDVTDTCFVTARDERHFAADVDVQALSHLGPILVSLRDGLAQTLRNPRYLVDAAVFSVPAALGPQQIEALRQAAQTVGLEVVELLPEPAAAAVYQSWAEGLGGLMPQEPDLCIVHGAALHAAARGTHYLDLPRDLELHLTSPAHTRYGTEPDRPYRVTGAVGGPGAADFGQGGSVRVRSFATGLTGEAFLDATGTFALEVELQQVADNTLEIAILSPAGDEVACVPLSVRHGKIDPSAAPAPPAPPATDPSVQPPLPSLTRLVRRCLDLAAEVADATGRRREELFEHVYTQERYAEQAHGDNNQPLYRECVENLGKYAAYLEQLLRDAFPRPLRGPSRSPGEEARDGMERFRECLAEVWRKVRADGRADLNERLAAVACQGQGLAQRARTDPPAAIRDVRRLLDEIDAVAQQLASGPPPPAGGEPGLLEGTS